ncbi:hypothetical protein GF336_01550 [Candidatus Woesearchaeota archaeon]|nr:hypothetical protein [Candidatus Woesearchaeota archaeon]
MNIDDHCDECREKLGKDFREVHEWLDKFYKEEKRIEHRRYRHHLEGMIECRKLFGEAAGKAAEMHIKQDFFGYMPHKNDYYRKKKFWEEMGRRKDYIYPSKKPKTK